MANKACTTKQMKKGGPPLKGQRSALPELGREQHLLSKGQVHIELYTGK